LYRILVQYMMIPSTTAPPTATTTTATAAEEDEGEGEAR
jgi:hypothetical protein